VVVGIAGTLAVALVSVATIVAGWHRFSDGVGAILLAVAGAGLVVLLTPITPRRPPEAADLRPVSTGTTVL
jgi:membrane-associated phospholipid phosphatase